MTKRILKGLELFRRAWNFMKLLACNLGSLRSDRCFHNDAMLHIWHSRHNSRYLPKDTQSQRCHQKSVYKWQLLGLAAAQWVIMGLEKSSATWLLSVTPWDGFMEGWLVPHCGPDMDCLVSSKSGDFLAVVIVQFYEVSCHNGLSHQKGFKWYYQTAATT